MEILVTGASGSIASHLIRDLLSAGHTVTCCVRDVAYTKTLFPNARVIHCDFINDTSVEKWLPRVKNIDVVINAVGIFYHPIKKIIWKIHYETPIALFQACAQSKVKKIIQISALGVDKVAVDYAQSKKAADDFLLTLPIPAFIIRPSVVYGGEWKGGIGLFLSLASLPWIVPLPGSGKQQFQPIHVEDIAQAVANLAEVHLHKSVILHAVSDEKISLRNMLIILRSWLGLAPARFINVPLWLIGIGSLMGNLFPGSMLNIPAYKMMKRNNITNSEEAEKFAKTSKMIPKSFKEGVFSQPYQKLDLLQARLFFLKPLAKFSLAFMWIASAICSAFLYSKESSYLMLSQVGAPLFLQPWLLYGASALNLFLGLAMFTRFAKPVYYLQLLTIILYTFIITVKLPLLWLEPFGPVVKNIPILVLILICLSLENRK